MHLPHAFGFRTATLCALLTLGFLSPAAGAADAKPAAAPAAKTIYETKDTADIITIAKAALAAVAADKKDVMAAKAGELAAAWGAKASVLRPKDEQRWWAMDVGVSKAVAALRGRKLDPERAKAFLEQTVQQLEEATKR